MLIEPATTDICMATLSEAHAHATAISSAFNMFTRAARRTVRLPPLLYSQPLYRPRYLCGATTTTTTTPPNRLIGKRRRLHTRSGNPYAKSTRNPNSINVAAQSTRHKCKHKYSWLWLWIRYGKRTEAHRHKHTHTNERTHTLRTIDTHQASARYPPVDRRLYINAARIHRAHTTDCFQRRARAHVCTACNHH